MVAGCEAGIVELQWCCGSPPGSRQAARASISQASGTPGQLAHPSLTCCRPKCPWARPVLNSTAAAGKGHGADCAWGCDEGSRRLCRHWRLPTAAAWCRATTAPGTLGLNMHGANALTSFPMTRRPQSAVPRPGRLLRSMVVFWNGERPSGGGGTLLPSSAPQTVSNGVMLLCKSRRTWQEHED